MMRLALLFGAVGVQLVLAVTLAAIAAIPSAPMWLRVVDGVCVVINVVGIGLNVATIRSLVRRAS